MWNRTTPFYSWDLHFSENSNKRKKLDISIFDSVEKLISPWLLKHSGDLYKSNYLKNGKSGHAISYDWRNINELVSKKITICKICKNVTHFWLNRISERQESLVSVLCSSCSVSSSPTNQVRTWKLWRIRHFRMWRVGDFPVFDYCS